MTNAIVLLQLAKIVDTDQSINSSAARLAAKRKRRVKTNYHEVVVNLNSNKTVREIVAENKKLAGEKNSAQSQPQGRTVVKHNPADLYKTFGTQSLRYNANITSSVQELRSQKSSSEYLVLGYPLAQPYAAAKPAGFVKTGLVPMSSLPAPSSLGAGIVSQIPTMRRNDPVCIFKTDAEWTSSQEEYRVMALAKPLCKDSKL